MVDRFVYRFPHRSLVRTDALNRVDVGILFRDTAARRYGNDVAVIVAGARVAVHLEDAEEAAAFTRILGASEIRIDPAPGAPGFAEAVLAEPRADLLVLGSDQVGAAALVARLGGPPVLVVQEGARDRPVEALAQAFRLDRVLGGLEGREIALLGDPVASPLLHALASLLQLLGARMCVVAPSDVDTGHLAHWGLAISPLAAALQAADAFLHLDAAKPAPCGLKALRRGFAASVDAALAETGSTRPVLRPEPGGPDGLALRAALVTALLGRAEAIEP